MTDRKEQNQTEAQKQDEDVVAYPLGTSKRPYPMMRKFTNEEGRIEYDLGVLEDDNNPLKIHSQRDYAEMVGLAYRDMPTPGMLRLFQNGMRQRDPQDPRKVEFMMGDPGAGKSFLAGLHAKMRDPRGAILVDCGGRDLGELLYETILDYSGGQTVYDEIDSKLASGELNPTSVNLLKSKLGKAFIENGDRAVIDWQEVGAARIDSDQLDAESKAIAEKLGLSEKDLEGDPEKNDKLAQYHSELKQATKELTAQAEKARDGALDAIREVAKLEGLDKGGDASIGLTVKEGPLIRAWREKRPVILDEYNKGKPGTDDALQVLWQVFNGEMTTHTVKGGGGKEFTFDRSEMPQNFFVTLTGNLTKDGYSTRSLSASAYQRLQPQYIESPGVADWQHRICQKLTGMPVSTIYNANKKYWSEHKEEFTDFLIGMRKRGLSEQQQANIPAWQFEMLKNWDRVMKASEQLAGFYHTWAQATDPDSELYQDMENHKVQDMLDQVDERYRDEVAIGLRSMLRNIDQATIVQSDAKPSFESLGLDPNEDWDLSPDLPPAQTEEVEKRFGTRLSNVILEELDDKTHNRDRLLTWLLVRAAEAGLFEKELEEGRTTGDSLISDLLDLDPELQKHVPENIEEIHGLLCDYLRDKFDGLSEENTDIISARKLEQVLSQMGHNKEADRATNRSGIIYVPNEEVETLHENPLTSAISIDYPLVDPGDDSHLDAERKDTLKTILEEEAELHGIHKLPTSELAEAERLLVGLAIPNVGQKNVKALWNSYTFDCAELGEEDSAAKIAVGESETGLSTQLLKCKTKGDDGEERNEYLYVVHDGFANRGAGKTLVTGTTEISDKLASALAKNHITYVNRNAPDAAQQVEDALKDITAGKSDIDGANMSIENSLLWAITHRVVTKHVEMVKNENGVERPQDKTLFELPHMELLDANNSNTTISPEIRDKARENLVALLTDKEQYLDKSERYNLPYLATSSPDLDQLKHTVRALTQGAGEKQAGVGK